MTSNPYDHTCTTVPLHDAHYDRPLACAYTPFERRDDNELCWQRRKSQTVIMRRSAGGRSAPNASHAPIPLPSTPASARKHATPWNSAKFFGPLDRMDPNWEHHELEILGRLTLPQENQASLPHHRCATARGFQFEWKGDGETAGLSVRQRKTPTSLSA